MDGKNGILKTKDYKKIIDKLNIDDSSIEKFLSVIKSLKIGEYIKSEDINIRKVDNDLFEFHFDLSEYVNKVGGIIEDEDE